MSEILKGHNSPETAYVVNDYPYGFRLRCKIRYWLEYKANHGFRFMSQTTNPKRPGEVWNKPKASTYTHLAVMILKDANEKGIREVTWTGFSSWDMDLTKLYDFMAKYSSAFEVAHVNVCADMERAINRYNERKALTSGATGVIINP